MCRTSCSPLIETPMPPASKTKKSVNFSSSEDVVLEHVVLAASNNMSRDEMDSLLWWHQHDIDDFLQAATKNSTDAMKHKLLMDGLDHALQNSRPQQQLLKQLDHADDNDMMMDDYLRNVPEDRGLTLWCRFGHSRRGLERLSSRLHYESRAYAAEKSRAEVIRLSCGGSGAIDELELRQVYERSTIAAKVFARMIAISDEIAARAIDTMPLSSKEGDSDDSQQAPTKRATRRNTQPSYSGGGGENKNVPPVIMIPALLTRNSSMRRWSA